MSINFYSNEIKEYFFFVNNIDNLIIKKINQFKKKSIIYAPDNGEIDLVKIIHIKNVCKKNQIPCYIMDNFKLANRLNIDGVTINSKNKKVFPKTGYKLNFKIIGIAHNQLEYCQKVKQNCNSVMLSPIFYNPKFKIDEILGPIKFRLKKLNWNLPVIALAGVNFKNLKKVKLSGSSSVAIKSGLK
jgi:thiamine-phosphate pyrophosphorylase